jgi:hypothetical protein
MADSNVDMDLAADIGNRRLRMHQELATATRGRVQLVYNITITILDIIYRPVFYLKHDVSETGFCLRLQVKPIQLGKTELVSEPGDNE